MAGGRMRELLKKYGKVALGVHFTVSTASIAGLYVAIRNNVDVDSLFNRIGLSSPSPEEAGTGDGDGDEQGQGRGGEGRLLTNRTAELAASSGGALALAVICNKALFPVRVPITVALTPAVARFLARRNIFKNHL